MNDTPKFMSPRIRLHIDATIAGPIIAVMLGRVLSDAGAKVSYTELDMLEAHKPIKSLEGLEIVIDRITWVRNEEAERWLKREET